MSCRVFNVVHCFTTISQVLYYAALLPRLRYIRDLSFVNTAITLLIYAYVTQKQAD